jgi:hypothetical protein
VDGAELTGNAMTNGNGRRNGKKASLFESEDWASSSGWCPKCGLHSVIAYRLELICSSPTCRWVTERTTDLEAKVFERPPRLEGERLQALRSAFGLDPVG